MFSAATIDELRSWRREAIRRSEELELKALDADQKSVLYGSAYDQLTARAQTLEADAGKSEAEAKPQNATDQRAAAQMLKSLAMENREKARTQGRRAEEFEHEASDQRVLAHRFAVLIGQRGR